MKCRVTSRYNEERRPQGVRYAYNGCMATLLYCVHYGTLSCPPQGVRHDGSYSSYCAYYGTPPCLPQGVRQVLHNPNLVLHPNPNLNPNPPGVRQVFHSYLRGGARHGTLRQLRESALLRAGAGPTQLRP